MKTFKVPHTDLSVSSVVLGLMLIGSINYNLSLGHALVFLLAGIGMVAMVHTFRNLVRLRLTPGRANPVFAGETAYFQIVLENTAQQPRRGHGGNGELAAGCKRCPPE